MENGKFWKIYARVDKELFFKLKDSGYLNQLDNIVEQAIKSFLLKVESGKNDRREF